MKKTLLFVTFSMALLFCACNSKANLGENEYQITGTVADASLDGKNVILEKQGGYMGIVPVDTVKIENGKFVFKDTVSAPALNFISIEGIPSQKVTFIKEKGEINITVNKDTLQLSKIGGTPNNEMFQNYSELMKDHQKKNSAIEDIIASNSKFVKDNPKAFINVFIIDQLMRSRQMEEAEVKALYDGLDEEVKNTKEGKEIGGMFAASIGSVAPDFSAATPDGGTMSLKKAMGKVTIIDFWASWCKPCRMENPNVVAMYNELHDKGLNIIGVSLDKEAEAWKKAIADDGLTWNHISNLKFWEDPIAKQYAVQSIPATFVLDKDGKIVAKNLRGEELKAKVQELLAE